MKTLAIIAVAFFIQSIQTSLADARILGPDRTNDLKFCAPDVRIAISKAKKKWGPFEFRCGESGLITSLSSTEKRFKKESWAGTIKEHLGLFGIAADDFAFFPDEGFYYQQWGGLPINHRHFSWYYDTIRNQYLIFARTVRTSSWKSLPNRKPTFSRAFAEKKAREAVQDQFKRPLKIKESVLMVSDGEWNLCSKNVLQYIWIVIGEESTGPLECVVAETPKVTCPVSCARSVRYGESF